MAHGTETKFGDLQMEERYKKLERSLKLASLKDGKRKGTDPWPLPTSPGISSINGDTFDSSTNIQSLQSVRINSKVVSSSNNLRNIILNRKCINSDPEGKGIATSSVKKFNAEGVNSIDLCLMPPPNFLNVCHRNRNSNSTLTHNVPKSLAMAQNDYNASDIDIASPAKDNYYKVTNNSGKVTDSFSSLEISTNKLKYRKARIFRNWKVMLNELGQLIIKGTLECGSIARSKPISKRLTSATVQSIFNHIYHLQGNIADDAHELPDYIRGKFYNGFPDDWANVHEIWASFVKQKCNTNFHWPTRITDSDDDIKSDISFAYSKVREDKSVNSNSFKKSYLLFDSKFTNNTLQTRAKQNVNLHNCKKSDSSTQTCELDTIGNSFHNAVRTQMLTKQFGHDKENYKEQRTTETTETSESLASKLKDKLYVILNNVTDKNCPQACISQCIKISDCLNYILSHGSINESESNIEAANAGHKMHGAQGNNEIVNTSQDYLQQEVNSMQNFTSNKIANCNSFLKRKRTFAEMNKEGCNSNSDGESELYTGIPKISLERIIRQKENLTKSRRRKMKKEMIYVKPNTIQKEPVPNMPEILLDKMTNGYIIAMKNAEDKYFYDSSVSIIQEKRDNLLVEKNIRSTIQDNFDNHTETDIVKGHRWERSNDQSINKHVNGMQGHFVQENFTAIHKPTWCIYNTYDAGDQNKNDIAVTKKAKDKVSEVNSCMKTKQDTGSESVNNENHVSCRQPKEISSSLKIGVNKMSKPVIISAVSANIDINTESKRLSGNRKVIKNGEVVVTAPNEENEIKTMKKSASARKSDAVKKPNTILVTDPVEFVEERVKVPLSSQDFASNGSSGYNTNVMQHNQVTRDNKRKMLSAWTPRVICKSGLHLIFEGKLLNDADHVVCKKFTTDVVLRRVSPKVFETVGHEFYELIGELNDTKHVVPRELVMHCRYGCPLRIEQFCKSWNGLRSADVVDSAGELETLKDMSMDTINVGVSSKGRRIIRPLSYWTGERIALKDNNPVYSPGTAHDTLSVHDTFIKNKQEESANTWNRYGGKKAKLTTSQNLTKNLPEEFVNKPAYQCTKVGNLKLRGRPKKKRRIVRVDSTSSGDDTGLPLETRQKAKVAQQEPFNSANVVDKRDPRSITEENSHESHIRVDRTELTPSKLKASNEATSAYNSHSKQMSGNCESSSVKYRDVVCTYYQDIPVQDDELSDYQASHV